MKYFIASFLPTVTLHGWLILSQWGTNPETLSNHAVKSKFYFGLYTTVHLISAVLLSLFMKAFFGNYHWSGVVLFLAIIAAVAEILQALIPSKGKYEVPHTISAVIMALSMWLICLVCTILFARNTFVFWVNIAASILIGSFFLNIKYPPKEGFWK